jgi:hypothetical protein
MVITNNPLRYTPHSATTTTSRMPPKHSHGTRAAAGSDIPSGRHREAQEEASIGDNDNSRDQSGTLSQQEAQSSISNTANTPRATGGNDDPSTDQQATENDQLRQQVGYLMQQLSELSGLHEQQQRSANTPRPTTEHANPTSPPRAHFGHEPEPLAPQRAATYDSMAHSIRSQIPKVANMSNKLSDGKSFRASLWKALVLDRLSAYEQTLFNESLRRQYVIDQVEGIALEFLEGLYLQQPPLTASQLITEVSQYMTDPSEAERAADQYHVLTMGKLTFSEFYRQFRLLAITARITDQATLRRDLTSKVTDFYRRASGMGRMASSDLQGDVKVYQWLESNEDGIKLINLPASRTAPSAATRKNPGSTYTSSRQELTAQARQPPTPASAIRNTPTVQPANTPRHFSATPSPAPAYNRGTTPFRTNNTERAKSFTPHTVGEVETEELEEDYADAVEEQDPAAGAEAVALAQRQEMTRAKDAA